MTYIVGSHWFICDVCGQKYRSTEKRKRWDGLIVCPADNEADHPQKYIRVESDGQAVPDPRPRPEDVFALPIYCTPVTRTAAADDGTADCMTVDYRLNINYAEYGGYQPIETSTPTLYLLDTFTATNGTDPVSRDIDLHPATSGMARWLDAGGSTGVIQDGNLVHSVPPGAPYSSFSYELTPTDGTVFESPSLFLMMRGKSLGIVAYNETITLYVGPLAGASYAHVRVIAGGGYDYVAEDSGGGYFGTNGTLSSDVYHNIGLHFSGGTVSLIVDGAVAASGSVQTPVVETVNIYGGAFMPVGVDPGYVLIDQILVRQGITLAEATALTV